MFIPFLRHAVIVSQNQGLERQKWPLFLPGQNVQEAQHKGGVGPCRTELRSHTSHWMKEAGNVALFYPDLDFNFRGTAIQMSHGAFVGK